MLFRSEPISPSLTVNFQGFHCGVLATDLSRQMRDRTAQFETMAVGGAEKQAWALLALGADVREAIPRGLPCKLSSFPQIK